MTGLVVDASVTAAWYFDDEETQYSRNVLRHAHGFSFFVPAIWPVEMANVLLVNERRKRITAHDTARAVALFKELAIRVDQAGNLQPFDAPMLLARAHGLSAYDASYLELALREALPLATLDVRLRTRSHRRRGETACLTPLPLSSIPRYIEVGRVETRSGRKPTFLLVLALLGTMAKAAAAVEKIEAIARSVAEPEGIEVVEVELKGGGKNQFLRISIDKPEGVTHADCELMSRQVGDLLDTDDSIPAHYTLEVSSPGVERKLLKPADWVRFCGKRAKVVLREPLNGQKTFEGIIGEPATSNISLVLNNGQPVEFPFSNIDRANLKFEW